MGMFFKSECETCGEYECICTQNIDNKDQNLSSNDFKNYILYGKKPITKKVKIENGRNKRVKG